MKKKILLISLICTALLTSCGSSKYSESAAPYNALNGAHGIFDSKGYSSDSAATYEEAASEDGYYAADNTVYAETDDPQTEKAQTPNVNSESIDRDMLVYSCTMGVDVLEFDSAVDKFRGRIEQYQGFVESERFSDGGSSSRWYDENEQKWSTYTATVRVPSRVYEDFCNAFAELGDLRSKNASVQNVSQEYHDLSTTLAIYEQKEERYLEMLSKAKDEANAVAVEDKLTDIQVEIAKLKTRMNQIKTDVAYSYVYVTINEVKEYQAEPVHNDTFGERLVNTLKDAGTGFLEFLEALLFFLIYAFPYVLVFGLIIAGLVKLVKTVRTRKKAKEEKKAAVKAENVKEKAAPEPEDEVKPEK